MHPFLHFVIVWSFTCPPTHPSTHPYTIPQVLAPAIELAEGFPVAPVAALWGNELAFLKSGGCHSISFKGAPLHAFFR